MFVDSEQVHIASLVVYCLPDLFNRVVSDVKLLKDVELHAPDPVGKFVVLLETTTEAGILSMISRIDAIPGVLNVTMVYHEIDTDDQESIPI